MRRLCEVCDCEMLQILAELIQILQDEGPTLVLQAELPCASSHDLRVAATDRQYDNLEVVPCIVRRGSQL